MQAGGLVAALRDGEDDVVARDGDEAVARAGAVVADELDDAVGERDELALGGVEEVRDAAAVALLGERQEPRDAVARGLDVDAFVAVLHVSPSRWQPAHYW